MRLDFRYLLLIASVFVVSSCSNEVEVLADYQENVAIYGLLDPGQSMQFIRITKVFTNPDARSRDVAKIADSLYFDSLAPVLVELENDIARRTIPLFKANVLLKDSGIFANSPNYLYVTTEPILKQYKYRLDITLPKSGRYVTATTNIVHMGLNELFKPVNPSNPLRTIFISPFDGSNVPVSFTTGKNGKVYDAYFVFNYLEVNKADTTIKTAKTLRWKILKSFRAIEDKGKEIVSQRMPGRLFYDMLLNKISNDTNVYRRFLPCSVEFIGANLELDIYMESTSVSIGIVQKQTEYTNISGGGIGIFASRATAVIDNVFLGEPTKNTLLLNPDYKHLGFR
jgi:hypothetical protein